MPLLFEKKKIIGIRYMACLSMRTIDHLGQVKFVDLFKVTGLISQVIMMKPEIQLIMSAARLYWS